MTNEYKHTVVDAFAMIGGSGGCAFWGKRYEVTQTHNGVTIKLDGLIFYMPDYISIKNFITTN